MLYSGKRSRNLLLLMLFVFLAALTVMAIYTGGFAFMFDAIDFAGKAVSSGATA